MSVRLSLRTNRAKKDPCPSGGGIPWLVTSRQRWKLRAAFLAVISSLFGFYVAAHNHVLGGVALQLGSAVLAAALTLSVRCHYCGEYVAWWALTTLPVGKCLDTLRQLPARPTCGNRGNGSEPSG